MDSPYLTNSVFLAVNIKSSVFNTDFCLIRKKKHFYAPGDEL